MTTFRLLVHNPTALVYPVPPCISYGRGEADVFLVLHTDLVLLA